MNRAELDLYTADVEAQEKLAAAKAAYREKPTDTNKEKLATAKREIYELRAHWRGIREYFHPDAVIPTKNVKTRSK